MTPPRFLIDENLSVKLPELAHKRGFEASHVAHLGLREWKDWNILGLIEAQNWVLVTNNAIEFRARYEFGRKWRSASTRLSAAEPIPGFACRPRTISRKP